MTDPTATDLDRERSTDLVVGFLTMQGFAQFAAHVRALDSRYVAERERADTHVCTVRGWTEDDVERQVSRLVDERDEAEARVSAAEAALTRIEQLCEHADAFTGGLVPSEHARAAAVAAQPKETP